MTSSPQHSPWRLFGLGLEFAGAVVVLILIGLWVDRSYGTDPWGVVVGMVVGLAGAFYTLLKRAQSMSR